jgi:fermentation-respiration switch protein FrsA (DUF1100 family)
MKKIIITTVTFIAGILFTFGQGVAGDWNGLLTVQGMKFRLVFHITQNADNYTATMDSPDQGAKGIPMTGVRYDGKTLILEQSAAKITFTGTFADEKITGNFTQGGLTLPMELTRETMAKPEGPRRPQEPLPPYPYIEEIIKFKNLKAGITLAGTLTLPKGNGPFTAVVLVTGSGAQNRDEELLGHKPFKVLADYLTRNGIAVLRYDDRGSFESEGDFRLATTFDFASDAESAVDYLRSRKEINPLKTGIIGHSEGGIVAPIVATQTTKVAFIVLMAGPGLKGSEIILSQQELIGNANGVNPDKLKTSKEINAKIFEMVDKISNKDSLRSKVKDYIISTAANVEEMDIPTGQTIDKIADSQADQLLNPWMLNFLKYDPAPTLAKVKCPVLAIIGSKDLQVSAKANLTAIEQALSKGKNKHFITKELSGLNHLFQECQTGSPNEYGNIEQTISPSALTTICEWIKNLK